MPRAIRGRFKPLDHFVLGHLSILAPLTALGSPHAAKRFIGVTIVVRRRLTIVGRWKDRGSRIKHRSHEHRATLARTSLLRGRFCQVSLSQERLRFATLRSRSHHVKRGITSRMNPAHFMAFYVVLPLFVGLLLLQWLLG